VRDATRQVESVREASGGSQAILSLLISIDRRLALIADSITDNPSPTVIHPNQSYTRRQTARLLGVSTWTVDRARKDGLLVEARRIGQRDVRITGESILEFHQRVRRTTAQIQKL
jgi:hypothetical protein